MNNLEHKTEKELTEESIRLTELVSKGEATVKDVRLLKEINELLTEFRNVKPPPNYFL